MERSINFGELLPMQLGQILYTETEKSSTESVNATDRTEYTSEKRGHYMTVRRQSLSSSV